ncbi:MULTISPECIES: hypothetical protein [unclassified Sphingomonas]|jgi:hypothetical protein|nr:MULTISPECIES: hypothetical protein [unclassified Sphingomonas]
MAQSQDIIFLSSEGKDRITFKKEGDIQTNGISIEFTRDKNPEYDRNSFDISIRNSGFNVRGLVDFVEFIKDWSNYARNSDWIFPVSDDGELRVVIDRNSNGRILAFGKYSMKIIYAVPRIFDLKFEIIVDVSCADSFIEQYSYLYSV